jgi:hypothetical protein
MGMPTVPRAHSGVARAQIGAGLVWQRREGRVSRMTVRPSLSARGQKEGQTI